MERDGDHQSVRSQPGVCLEVPVCNLHSNPVGDLLKGLNRDVIEPYVCLGTFLGVYRMVPKGADVKQK